MKNILYLLLLVFSDLVTAQSDFKLKISGEVSVPLQLSLEELKKMPHKTAVLKDKQGNTHIYSGIPVWKILMKAGLSKEPHGSGVSKYLLVKSADGYKVLFSLAELDEDFTDKNIIMADGKELPESKGPLRIIIEGEKKPARSSFQVTELIVGSIKN